MFLPPIRKKIEEGLEMKARGAVLGLSITLILLLGAGGYYLADQPACTATAYFVTPEIDHVIQKELISLILGARDELYLAIYSFTDDELGSALIAAHDRGVEVAVIIESENAFSRGSEVPKLLRAGIPVHGDGQPGLFHHKFLVIDRKIVVTGSYNWSHAADDRNFENIVVITDPTLATVFATEFLRLLKVSRTLEDS